MQAVLHAIRDGRVVVKDKHADRIGLGIVQADFAEDLKRLRRYLIRIGGEAVGDF